MLIPEYETNVLSSTDYQRIVGIDEVGRGPLAGPVSVGMYIYYIDSPFVEGVNDSKQVKPKIREEIFSLFQDHSYKVLLGHQRHIDKFGISKVIEAMIRSIIRDYDDGKTKFLLDGVFKADFGKHTKTIIKGDTTHYSIAAASILAKVVRDSLMSSYEGIYPGYGFSEHKGYATQKHREALIKLGPSPLHRMSFRPIAN